MWNQLESYKHHFLQMELPYMQPKQISPLVRKEFETFQSDRDQCCMPNKGKCQSSTYFQDHAQLAYGWFALPKLIRELCSDDREVRWRATNSLSEFLQNPLNAQRAVNEMDIVRLLNNSFLRIRFRRDEKCRITESILNIFGTLSIYLNGAKQILSKRNLCAEFYGILLDHDENMERTSQILRNLTEKPEVLHTLLEETNFFERLADVFQSDVCRPNYPYTLWVHLSHLLEVAPERGVELGFFDILHRRIVGRLPKYHQMTMKCFALLLRCESGQKLFRDCDGVLLLYNIFKDRKVLDTCEYLVMALLHGLQSKSAMWRCREFTDLPLIITKLASKKYRVPEQCQPMMTMKSCKMSEAPQLVCRKAPRFIYKGHESLQYYCFKILRQMGEMPCIKNFIKANCLHDIREAECFNRANECERDDLVQFLEREIYDSNVLKG